MLSLGTSALRLYQSAKSTTSLITSLTSFKNWLIYISNDVDTKLKFKLEKLSRRIDILIGPLNYILLYCHNKSSILIDLCFNIRGILERIEIWSSKVSILPNVNHEELIEILDSYIDELDFSINSLTLAVSVVNSAKPLQPINIDKNGNIKNNISLSSYLRASRRIEAYYTQTGDITCSIGSLYVKELEESAINKEWKLLSSSSSFKVHSNAARSIYELHVEVLNNSNVDRNCFELTLSLNIQLTSSLALGIPADINVLNFAISWSENFLNAPVRKYAFVFENLIEAGNVKNISGVRPLDLLYICRLCAFDNSNKTVNSLSPPHLQLTDEEIWVLLQDSVDDTLNVNTASSLWSDTSSVYDGMSAFNNLSSTLISALNQNIQNQSTSSSNIPPVKINTPLVVPKASPNNNIPDFKIDSKLIPDSSPVIVVVPNKLFDKSPHTKSIAIDVIPNGIELSSKAIISNINEFDKPSDSVLESLHRSSISSINSIAEASQSNLELSTNSVNNFSSVSTHSQKDAFVVDLLSESSILSDKKQDLTDSINENYVPPAVHVSKSKKKKH